MSRISVSLFSFKASYVTQVFDTCNVLRHTHTICIRDALKLYLDLEFRNAISIYV